MRLIDADALKDKLQQHHDFYVMAWGGFGKMPIGEKKRVDEINNCIAEVVNAPTIEPKRGEWKRRIVDNGFNADWVCSECGYRVKTDFVDYNFCPNCGADMREREGECIECHYEPKDEPMKTADYCDICKRDMCEDCIADATNPYCVPSHYEINYEPKDEPQTDCSWK